MLESSAVNEPPKDGLQDRFLQQLVPFAQRVAVKSLVVFFQQSFILCRTSLHHRAWRNETSDEVVNARILICIDSKSVQIPDDGQADFLPLFKLGASLLFR